MSLIYLALTKTDKYGQLITKVQVAILIVLLLIDMVWVDKLINSL